MITLNNVTVFYLGEHGEVVDTVDFTTKEYVFDLIGRMQQFGAEEFYRNADLNWSCAPQLPLRYSEQEEEVDPDEEYYLNLYVRPDADFTANDLGHVKTEF